MMIPIHGGVEYVIEKNIIKSSARESVVFLSGARRVAKTSKLSEAIIQIDPERLQRTEKAVFGSNYFMFSNLQLDREISLKNKNQNFYSTIEKIFSLIGSEEDVEGDNSIIYLVDDLIYRAMVMLMVPAEFQVFSRKDFGSAQEKMLLKNICDYIKSDIFSNIDLVNISRNFNITTANIEYLFIKHFNKSIHRWVNSERVCEIEFLCKNLSASKIGLQILNYASKDVNNIQRFERLCSSLGWVNDNDNSMQHHLLGDVENTRGRLLINKEMLQRLRRKNGWSQSMLVDEAAKKSLRISLATIKRAEMGSFVSFRTALSIAQLFNIDLPDLVSDGVHSSLKNL